MGEPIRKSKNTEKEQLFIELAQKTKNPKVACDLVYPGESLTRILRDRPQVKRKIIRIINRAGLKEKWLAEKIKYIIDSSEDDNAKLRAVDMALKLHGSYAPEQVNVKADFDIWRHFEISDIKREIIDAIEDG